MPVRLSFLSLVLLLTSCAYIIERTDQDITVVTPGAHNSVCYVYVGGLKYKFRPPQTVKIGKSEDTLVVNCLAPGNRRKSVEVEPDIEAITLLGGPGVAWDYLSDALFVYPELIEVDFTGIPATAMPLPAHNNPDIKQPEEYYLEEFSPGQPRMNADRHAPEIELKRREFETEDDVYYPEYGLPKPVGEGEASGDGGGKGDLMSVRQLTPQQEPSSPPESVPLFPVE